MCKVAPDLPTSRGPGSWDGDSVRECALCPMRVGRGAAAARSHCSPTLRAGKGGRATWRGRRTRGPHAPPLRSGGPLNETLRSPGRGRPRGHRTLEGGAVRAQIGVLGMPPPRGGAQPGARVWRGSAGGERPFVCSGKVRPRELQLRFRAGGWGGNICSALMQGEAAAVAWGREQSGRGAPASKGSRAAPPARASGVGGGGLVSRASFHLSSPKGRRPVPPYSQSGSKHLLSLP